MSKIDVDQTYVELVTFEIEDAQTQNLLIEALADQVETWIRETPGFIAAHFHKSLDEKKVVNYAQWQSRAAWEIFGADERRQKIRDAVKAVGARHVSGEGYAVARIIEARDGEK